MWCDVTQSPKIFSKLLYHFSFSINLKEESKSLLKIFKVSTQENFTSDKLFSLNPWSVSRELRVLSGHSKSTFFPGIKEESVHVTFSLLKVNKKNSKIVGDIGNNVETQRRRNGRLKEDSKRCEESTLHLNI